MNNLDWLSAHVASSFLLYDQIVAHDTAVVMALMEK